MEKKTNKAKLEIFIFLRKSALSQGYLSANSIYIYMLIREFLHAEFKSAMNTVQINTIFVKKQKNRKMNNFGNFC